LATLAGLLLGLALALALLASLLTALLTALSALAWAALALLSLLTLALAALTGTIHVISHGKFSALVDRGCAPTQNRGGGLWFLPLRRKTSGFR
jgi:hypothetical protein